MFFSIIVFFVFFCKTSQSRLTNIYSHSILIHFQHLDINYFSFPVKLKKVKITTNYQKISNYLLKLFNITEWSKLHN